MTVPKEGEPFFLQVELDKKKGMEGRNVNVTVADDTVTIGLTKGHTGHFTIDQGKLHFHPKGSEEKYTGKIIENKELKVLEFGSEQEAGQEEFGLTEKGLLICGGESYWYTPQEGEGPPITFATGEKGAVKVELHAKKLNIFEKMME